MLDDVVTLSESPLLQRLGSGAALDGRVHTYSSQLRGFFPINCYLLGASDALLLTDPGLPAIEQTLLRQLRESFPPNRQLAIFVSRGPEFDGSGNVAAVLDEFPADRVFGHTVYRFTGFLPRFPVPPEGTHLSYPVEGREWVDAHAGDVIAIDPSDPAGHSVELLAAPLRMLQTLWLYDPATRTLFTSDTFGHVVRTRWDESPVLMEDEHDPTTLDDVREHLLAKMWWLEIADTSGIVAAVESAFSSRPVEIVAPGSGCALVGAQVVQRHLDLVLSALEALGEKNLGVGLGA